MRNKNHRTDFRLDAVRMNHRAGKREERMNDGGLSRRAAIWMLVTGLAFLATAGPAFGQFAVQPMKVEIQVTPGKLVRNIVNIVSWDPNQVHTIDLSLVELTQSLEGAWDIVDPNDPNCPYDIAKVTASSCRSWIRMSSTSVTVQPLQSVPVELTLRVPRGVRGFHTAAILASIQPRPELTGVVVNVRFLVPIVVEIEGQALRPRIEAKSVGLEHVPAGGAGPGTTLVTMHIENQGGTFSRIRPITRVYSSAGGYERVITTTEFSETGIIPGATLSLKTNLRKTLPSGKYRVAGELYVDGRRTRRVEEQIDFVGDPKVARLAADAPLDLEPPDVTIEALPGAMRSGVIRVYNASKETVNVRTALGLPGVLQGKVLGETRGEDLDATRWLRIVPEQFTLQGEGSRQNLQVIAAMPDPAATHPCYYSLLALWATYPDGQGAGITTMPICVRNGNIVVQPQAEALKLDIQDLGGSKYLVAAEFGNFKNIHFTPITVRAGILPTTGATAIPRMSDYLGGNPGLWLPFERRQFSGVLDFTGIPADTYLLVGRLEYAPGQVARSHKLIQVSIEGGQRIVRTLGTQAETSGVEVKW